MSLYDQINNELKKDLVLLAKYENTFRNTKEPREINHYEAEIDRIKETIKKREAELLILKEEIQNIKTEKLSHGNTQAVTQSESSTQRNRKIPFILPQSDVRTFTGREEELTRLENLLFNNQGTKVCSIAGLAGAGGIGKSALACHFATKHKAQFPDGIIGIRVDGKDIETIAREFARRCGQEVDSEDERDATTIMQETFADRRMLLIFDNAENPNIKSLHPGGNRCGIIVTTRDRGLAISLNIAQENRINLTPLPEPDSLDLLEKLIGKDRTIAEPYAANDLLQLTGNLPLAIQIIGAQLQLNKHRPLSDYVNSLNEERRLSLDAFNLHH